MAATRNLNKAAIAALLPSASAHFLSGLQKDIDPDDFQDSWYSDDLIDQLDIVPRNVYACSPDTNAKVGSTFDMGSAYDCVYDIVDKNPVHPDTGIVWNDADVATQCPQEWMDSKIWNDAMCGDTKCAENFVYGYPTDPDAMRDVSSGYLPYMNADGSDIDYVDVTVAGSSEMGIGLANCPGLFTFSSEYWPEHKNSVSLCGGARGFTTECWYDQSTLVANFTAAEQKSDGSVGEINTESKDAIKIASEDFRKTLTAGQQVHVPYFLQSNHKGAMAWYLSKKDCGSTADCFEVVDGETSNANTATILEYDDDSTFPTWNKQWRMMNMVTPPAHCDTACQYGVQGEAAAVNDRGEVTDPTSAKTRVDDFVFLPADTESGKYVILARWESSTETSIFLNCHDVQVIGVGDASGEKWSDAPEASGDDCGDGPDDPSDDSHDDHPSDDSHDDHPDDHPSDDSHDDHSDDHPSDDSHDDHPDDHPSDDHPDDHPSDDSHDDHPSDDSHDDHPSEDSHDDHPDDHPSDDSHDDHPSEDSHDDHPDNHPSDDHHDDHDHNQPDDHDDNQPDNRPDNQPDNKPDNRPSDDSGDDHPVRPDSDDSGNPPRPPQPDQNSDNSQQDSGNDPRPPQPNDQNSDNTQPSDHTGGDTNGPVNTDDDHSHTDPTTGGDSGPVDDGSQNDNNKNDDQNDRNQGGRHSGPNRRRQENNRAQSRFGDHL